MVAGLEKHTNKRTAISLFSLNMGGRRGGRARVLEIVVHADKDKEEHTAR